MKIKLVNRFKCSNNCCVVGRNKNYIMNAAKISHSDILTRDINACVAGIVTAGKSNMMFHVAPEQQDFRHLDDIFYSKMQELFDDAKTEDCDAVICGGWNSNTKEAEKADISIRLYNKVADLLEDLGARVSIFCGKKQGLVDNLQFTRYGYAGIVADNWLECGINIDKIKNASPQEVSRVLQKKYETVEIHPAHEFIV